MKDKLGLQLAYHEKHEEWNKAIIVTDKLLATRPRSHWLLTRQSTHYYERFEYKTALKYSLKALKLSPHCPLVLWDYANVIDMLGRYSQARLVYKKLLRRGVDRIAYGECGEGKGWAEALLADCLYRIGKSYAKEGRRGLAIRFLRQHIIWRRAGSSSIYSIKMVRQKLADLEKFA